jgi:hypothetical protein
MIYVSREQVEAGCTPLGWALMDPALGEGVAGTAFGDPESGSRPALAQKISAFRGAFEAAGVESVDDGS